MLSYDTLRAVPHLASYEEASRWEANTKPIRGDADGTKPLGKRNQKYRSIRREPDGSIGVYTGWWYNSGARTPLVRYMPDGSLHLCPMSSHSASDNEIITRVTGMHITTEKGLWARYDGGTTRLNTGRYDKKEGRYVHDKPNVFVKNERGNWVPAQQECITTHVVNRRGAKEVRARYAEAIAYIKALGKLRRDSPPDNHEIIDAFESWFTNDDNLRDARRYGRWYLRIALPTPGGFEFTEGKAQAFMELLSSREPEHHYKVYLWLCVAPSIAIDTQIANALMQTHRHEWLKEKVHEPGKKAIDKYAWVFER